MVIFTATCCSGGGASPSSARRQREPQMVIDGGGLMVAACGRSGGSRISIWSSSERRGLWTLDQVELFTSDFYRSARWTQLGYSWSLAWYHQRGD
jgi:hypothetical protein